MMYPLLFLIYAFFGWILDTAFRSFSAGRLAIGVNFPLPQWMPLRPMYAVGVGILLLVRPLLFPLADGVEMLVIGVLMTVFEYGAAIVSERVSGRRLWDYHRELLNFQGRICLLNSIGWGVLGYAFLHILHPAMLAWLG